MTVYELLYYNIIVVDEFKIICLEKFNLWIWKNKRDKYFVYIRS